MKVRTSFVTNSSSSSFVIAIRNDATQDDIRQILIDKRSDIEHDIRCCYGDDEKYDWTELVNDIILSIFNITDYSCVKLGDWKVSSAEYSSEGDLYGGVIYTWFNDIDTERFKMRSN